MKPVYLEFCGINSFSEKTEIDFRTLLSGGVFGIFGDTGSGKSTILDCIHLALYGQIERSGNGGDYINCRSESAYVEFDFEITTDGVRHAYRVRRERKRKNNIAKAWLYERTASEELVAIAEGVRDVNDALAEIVGLNFADFKMCIALPQGDFDALVKSTAADRVKLVSRLFDLERYGDRLTKAVNEKYYHADNAVKCVEGKMQENADGSAERIEAKEKECEAARARLSEAEKEQQRAERVYEAAIALEKEKREYDKTRQRLAELERRLAEMTELQKRVERMPAARAVLREAEEARKNAQAAENARKAAEAAQRRGSEAAAIAEREKNACEAEKYEERVSDLRLALQKIDGAAEELNAEREAKRLLDDCRLQYRKLQQELSGENFDEARARIEKEIAALGEDETLVEYIERHGKALFLDEAYAAFRADLRALAEEVPEATISVEKLLRKYTPNETNETTDIERLHAAFKATEQRRKALRTERERLEKRARENEEIRSRMKTLQAQGEVYANGYHLAAQKTESVRALGEKAELEKRLEALLSARKKAEARKEAALEALQNSRAEAEKQKAFVSEYERRAAEFSEALKKALSENGFSSAEEAEALRQNVGNEIAARAECKKYFEEYELYRHKAAETDARKFENYDEGSLTGATEDKLRAKRLYDEENRRLATTETELKHLRELQEKNRVLEQERKSLLSQRELCDKLRALLRGNRFLEFIASEYLQEICMQASKTLLSLTNNRYFLRYDSDFKVGDNLDAGNLRAVRTLSGGETFLVSLSLALSLSAEICKKSLRPIEFFFLDEGFGTLDEHLVDTVMDVLGKLSKTFSVGLISHVEELKHRIGNKLLVTGASDSHGSSVKTERY